jgi:hypothetical protein
VRQDLMTLKVRAAAIEYFNLDATKKKHYWFLAEVLEQEE